MDYTQILERIRADIAPYVGQGRVADYIPELAKVPSAQFGLALETVDGQRHSTGDAGVPFSIQSISKLFTCTLAFQRLGEELWQRVGREPSGNRFNSLVQLEHEQGLPRNPFINAGALVVTDVLCQHLGRADSAVLEFLRRIAANPTLAVDEAVARSELEHSDRNRAMAHFMRSFGRLATPVDEVLQAYCRNCAIAMSCADLARAALFLANHGVVPHSGEHVLAPSPTKRLSALMLTCGTYDAAGDFVYRVGLPAKSGVGGGIVAVLPGHWAVCVWSPGLDPAGNSLAGVQALEWLTTLTGRSIF